MTPLHSLLSEQKDLYHAYFGSGPAVLRQAVSVEGLPTSAEINALLDGGMLKYPYFTLFQEGVKPPLAELTTSRRINGQDVAGFANPVGVRKHLAEGASIRMSDIEDWHPLTRRQVDELRETFPADVKTLMFLTPVGKRGLLPHRDGSRTIVIQLEGAKEWHLYWSEETDSADAGLGVDPDTEIDSFVLRPGDVMFMPHGYGHACTATGEMSLHLTFLLYEPTPQDLVAAFAKEWISTARMSTHGADHHTLSPSDKVDTIIADLQKSSHEIDADRLLDRALAMLADKDE